MGISLEDSKLEHRTGFEPMNTGFADQRVSHFATGAVGPALRGASFVPLFRAKSPRLLRVQQRAEARC